MNEAARVRAWRRFEAASRAVPSAAVVAGALFMAASAQAPPAAPSPSAQADSLVSAGVNGVALAPGDDIRAAAGAEVSAAYDRGDFVAAAALAEAHKDAPSLTMAARALIASVMLREADALSPRARIERAIADAQAALALNPRQIEAHIQLATAYGLKARQIGALAVARQGLASAARSEAEKAIALNDALPWGYAFLSVWHIEAVNAGGPIGATLIGASLKEGLRDVMAALARHPPDPVAGYQMALSLAAHDVKRHRALIDAALDDSLAAAPRGVFDVAMQTRARTLRGLIRAEDKPGLKAFLRTETDFK